MKRLSVIPILLLAACGETGSSARAEEAAKQKVAVEVRVEDKKLVIEVVNNGKEAVAVVTDVDAKSVGGIVGFERFVVGIREPRKSKGRLVIRGEASLNIVKIQPGEVAQLQIRNEKVLPDLLLLGPDDKLTVTVKYEVAESWAKRYKVWHGSVDTFATITGREVMAGK